MKKNLILLFILVFTGCVTKKQSVTEASCPEILFSKEHVKYIKLSNDLEDMEKIIYTAELNNFAFDSKCIISDKDLFSEVSILFIINKSEFFENTVTLPYYVGTINSKDELIDIQYYSLTKDYVNKSTSNILIDDEIIDTIVIRSPYDLDNYLLIGFMLDNLKIKILN